ncbi:hypothetical protein AOC05_06850 [Arthrobacter alpinus]|uniref:Peptidoglycan binding domain-containing protein n=1 Tax=Arthrobacter alpinus TaxID=656366 RepID=A0A0M3UFY0_9MICC|nr:hypothetical protein [Arthrobacter alpinus]ALE92115.1 hypothetical protein AOC05_06850 [Arthrobacter alpinus]
MSDRSHPRISFVASPLRLISLILVACLFLGLSFVLGLFVKSPNEMALTVADTQIPITVPATTTTISNATQIQATIVAGQTTGISVTAVEGADRPIATQVFVKPGDTLTPGIALGTVSGRPLFMTSNNVPLYRNLKLKDTGPDVQALQAEFASWGYYIDQSGVVGENFFNVLRAIYKSAGVALPGGDTPFFPWREFVHLPIDGATVTSVAAIGSELTKDSPLVQIKISPDQIIGRAGLTSGERFKSGAPVVLNFSGTKLDSTVSAVTGFIEGDGTKPSGIDISVSVPATLKDALPGATGTVSTSDSEITGLAVPLTGIRADSQGQYLLVSDDLSTKPAKENNADNPATRREPVEILGQAEGWVLLKPPTAVKEGELILVSP